MSTTISSGWIDLCTGHEQHEIKREYQGKCQQSIGTSSCDWDILCASLGEALKLQLWNKEAEYAWNAIVPLVFVIFLLFGFLGFASNEKEF